MSLRRIVVVVVCAVVVAACSSSSKRSGTAATTTPSTRSVPTGPVPTFTGPINGGKGQAVLAEAAQTVPASYVTEEYFASGTASSFKALNGLPAGGKWNVAPDKTASYETRLVVRRPSDPARYNGTTVVEWLNVSSGEDSPVEWTYTRDELVRRGYAWVGVSAQKTGVEGGTAVVEVAAVKSGGLKAADPVRYEPLHHPGDAYSYDIFTQIGRGLWAPTGTDPLGGLKTQRMIAVGESQSAFTLVTYTNAVQNRERVYDAILIHSRGGGAMPLEGGNIIAGIQGAIRVRDDIDVPVIMVQTETDASILGAFAARQPDSQHIRTWEVAGAAHADAYQTAGTDVGSVLGCSGKQNTAQTHYVVSSALSHLDAWVRDGTAAPEAPRFETKGNVIVRDANGNALGAIRTPSLAVPIATLSGSPADSSKIVCLLFGSTKPFSAGSLQRLYGTRADFLDKYTKATDAAIAAGFMLPEDRTAIIAEGQGNARQIP